MSKERDEAIKALTSAGVKWDEAARVYQLARRMARNAELACSSEAADRDRVECPKRFRSEDGCLCLDYGSKPEGAGHGDVPRYMVSDARAEAELIKILEPYGLRVNTGGDPRGYVAKVHFPDGRGNTWGGSQDGWGIA